MPSSQLKTVDWVVIEDGHGVAHHIGGQGSATARSTVTTRYEHHTFQAEGFPHTASLASNLGLNYTLSFLFITLPAPIITPELAITGTQAIPDKVLRQSPRRA